MFFSGLHHAQVNKTRTWGLVNFSPLSPLFQVISYLIIQKCLLPTATASFALQEPGSSPVPTFQDMALASLLLWGPLAVQSWFFDWVPWGWMFMDGHSKSAPVVYHGWLINLWSFAVWFYHGVSLLSHHIFLLLFFLRISPNPVNFTPKPFTLFIPVATTLG